MKLDLVIGKRKNDQLIQLTFIPDRAMNKAHTTESNKNASTKTFKPQHNRAMVISNIVDFEQSKKTKSQRQWAESRGVPRTTLQYWLKRKDNLDADPELVEFFESPVGLAFLHRLVCAAQFEFVENGVASIRNVSNFLELSGLSYFVASCYGAQQKAIANMDDLIIAFGKSEKERLVPEMALKKITLCEDETFHPDVCLVAIEPDSNYILLEKYAPDRKGETWNQSIDTAISGLPVEVIQVSSDEGKSLINHAEKGLGVHHSPDLFHVTHEITKGTSVALSSKIKKAENEYEKAKADTQKEKNLKTNYENQENHPPGRPPDFEKKIAESQSKEKLASEKLEQARENQETVKNAKIEIGRVYHPYHPETGEKQSAEDVADLLEKSFDDIREATESLSERSARHIDKAYRVLSKMQATIEFFFCMINVCLDNMNVSSKERNLMLEYIIPGFYLKNVASRERDPLRKELISQVADELLSVLYDRNGPFANYDDDRIGELERSGKECADIFQRSSSCVEGRNAQLSIHHQGLHRLSNRKLQAMTCVHNFYIKRSDGTTAAERFFGNKPKDMFEWLLDNMDFPTRGRKCYAVAA